MNKDIPFLFDESTPFFIVLCLYYNKDNKREIVSTVISTNYTVNILTAYLCRGAVNMLLR